MKKVKDHYYKKAKNEKHLARSFYKLEEINRKYRILKPGQNVIDLGASPGSWIEYVLKATNGNAKIIALDIKPLNQSFDKRVSFIEQDVLSFESDEILKHVDYLDVVLSDMAPNTSGDKELDSYRSIELSRKVMEIGNDLLRKGGTLVCKVFQGSEYKEFYDELRSSYQNLRTFKPQSSRKESKEIYLVGLNKLSEKVTQ